jgi:GAF domain-containing protein/HAMP domain-containing protein
MTGHLLFWLRLEAALWISLAIFGAIIPVMALLGWWVGNNLAAPITILMSGVESFTSGNMDHRIQVRSNDETKKLADAFNAMAEHLNALVTGLEQRVTDRTREIERRALQIQTAAEVGNAAASMRNLEELLTRVTHLISHRFGFYHVGIFLLDVRGEYAVLRASNSPGGQVMLAREHKLRVGRVGIVGYVTSTGNARVALDVGEDAVFFDNPDLPETRSEMALPLKIGDRIIGALDVQSTKENAFSEDDVQTLRLLADQLAIAIDNARLFAESQNTLATAQRAYSEIARTQWQDLLREKQKPIGLTILPKDQIVPAAEDTDPDFERAMHSKAPILSDDEATLYLPVKVMGNVIGVLRLVRTNNLHWRPEDINTVSTLADQLGAALESARLYEQITERAKREYLITDITSKIGSSIELEKIMQTTVEEIGRIFRDSEVILQLKKETGK